jgi:hypothetical protein
MCKQAWIKVYCRGGCGMKIDEYMAGPVKDCGNKRSDCRGNKILILCDKPKREYCKIGGEDFCHNCDRERLDRRRSSSYYGSNRRMERSRSGDGRRYIDLPYRN